jgi:hypothetical protein
VTVSTLTVVPEATASGTAPCAEPPTFLLGTHQAHWLTSAAVGLFVSDRRLRRYKTLPVAAASWACDSGGFTELQKYGEWTVTPAEYVTRLRRYRDETGRLLWAAPQDWMCEPVVINGGKAGTQRFAGTHLTVDEHQRRTVSNYLYLRELAPELPVIPVVQGWQVYDYLRCVELYERAGFDLTRAVLVGVGSVCRRQSTQEVGEILTGLHRAGVTRLHGFGFKIQGLARHGSLLTSADSMAWSAEARRRPPLLGCTHESCANCARYALQWRQRVLRAASSSVAQPTLFGLYGWAA